MEDRYTALATYWQSSPPPRDSVIAAAPESQNTHDRNRLREVSINRLTNRKLIMDVAHKIT
jgi:hypothetical protein